jgi:hypothetical protein
MNFYLDGQIALWIRELRSFWTPIASAARRKKKLLIRVDFK